MNKNNSKKRKLIIGTIAVIILLLIFLGYKSYFENISTNTSSDEFAILDEKLEFMDEYVNTFSKVIDAEYNIEYIDNSYGLLPGPSDYDIRIALKIPQDDVSSWYDGFDFVSQSEVNLNWWDILELEEKNWVLESEPDFYKREDQFVYLVVYRNEGVILKLISSRHLEN